MQRNRQRGVAAIEFALVFVILFSVLYALATFGAVFYAQQSVTRAAEEGARAAALITVPTTNDQRVKDAVYDTLAQSLVVPVSANANVTTRRTWITTNVTVTAAPSGTGAAASFIITVSYPYSANRILPTMPLLDASKWMPNQLVSQSSVALRP